MAFKNDPRAEIHHLILLLAEFFVGKLSIKTVKAVLVNCTVGYFTFLILEEPKNFHLFSSVPRPLINNHGWQATDSSTGGQSLKTFWTLRQSKPKCLKCLIQSMKTYTIKLHYKFGLSELTKDLTKINLTANRQFAFVYLLG